MMIKELQEKLNIWFAAQYEVELNKEIEYCE
jgi:hypothetical protein